MKCLILCSGGFKSAFVTGLSAKEYHPSEIRLLFIDYGQSAATAQRKSVVSIAEHYGLSYMVLNQGLIPYGTFRITTMLFSALSYASNIACDKLYYGACKSPRGVFNYELTHTHLRNMQMMIKAARYEQRKVRLPEPEAPCMLLNPRQIVMLGRNYGVPWELTWNCDNSDTTPCGICPGCMDWAQTNALRNTPKNSN